MDDLTARLVKQLKIEEGVKQFVYLDTKGIPTIAVGRNLQSVGVRPDEADLMLANDLADHIKFMSNYAWYNSESEVRKAALIDLSFMGVERLLHFVLMIAALQRQDFDEAASQVLNSQWFKDVGETRGNRVANMIRTGAWPSDIPPP